MTASVTARGIGVRFFFDRQQRVTTPLAARFRRKETTTWGIRGIDVEIGPGESVALLGPSGSGKTTFLRTLAGVLTPDEGELDVTGRVGSLLATNAGLIAPLTGRENTLLLGVLAGLAPPAARDALEVVRRRSGLADAFERPVSSYSQGMRARLGLAVIEQTKPQLLLLDEVHEALDRDFREVLESWAHKILLAGGIVVAAGHDHSLLERLCRRAVSLKNGKVAGDGPFDEIRGKRP